MKGVSGKLALVACMLVVCVSGIPLPTAEQLAWAQREIGVMICFNMETSAYNVSDIGFCNGKTGANNTYWIPEPSYFNPKFVDTDAWARAMVSFGAKYAVLTAKHCSGYAIWPTEVKGYEYSIKNSPWKNGKGDLVRDFINSAKKYNLAVGLYYHVGMNYYCNIQDGQFLNQTLLPGQINVTYNEYMNIVFQQITELWTQYGELAEIWFDGGTYNYTSLMLQLLNKYQPKAVAFQGPAGYANNIRWVGDELADPPYPCWSTANNSDAYGGGSVFPNSVWAPAESDTTIRNDDYWFWMDNYFEIGIKNVSTLFAQYEATVGRNTNFMLALTPDPWGVVPEEDVIEYQQLGEMIQRCYGKSIAEASGNNTISISLTFPPGNTEFNRIVISEDQTFGQRIRSYTVERLHDDKYEHIANGTSVGNKRIEVFDNSVKATGVQLTITDYVDVPVIAKFAAYLC
jgi:alpha-L-fucosidase